MSVHPRVRAVAVFGSSEPSPGGEAYREAFEVGDLLARAGFAVINGGYGGVMEASARGAREAGGRTIGVTTRAFRNRGGANPFIDREISEADLFARTRRLIERACGFIVLPGGVGTLAELAFLWALHKAALLGPKPIVLLGHPWEGLLAELRRQGVLQERDLVSTVVARSAREAVRAAGAPGPRGAGNTSGDPPG